MSEQQIQKKIITKLEANGCYVVKVVSASKTGVPDILGCYGGVFFAIEVKTPATRNKTTKLQDYNIDKVIETGGHATVMWDAEQVEDFLRSML